MNSENVHKIKKGKGKTKNANEKEENTEEKRELKLETGLLGPTSQALFPCAVCGNRAQTCWISRALRMYRTRDHVLLYARTWPLVIFLTQYRCKHLCICIYTHPYETPPTH